MNDISILDHNIEYSNKIINTFPTLPPLENKLFIKPSTPSESLYEANQLLTLLSDIRATDSTYWYTVGSILYNISQGTRDGLLSWIKFSKCSNCVFTEESCIRYWTEMKYTNYVIGTLRYYVKQDNMNQYLTYKKSQCSNHLIQYNRSNGGKIPNYIIAQALYILYKDEFLYHEGWYQFIDKKWVRIKECTELRGYIPLINKCTEHEVLYYRNQLTEIDNEIRNIEEEIPINKEEEDNRTERLQCFIRTKKTIENKRIAFLHSRQLLENTSFKNSIIVECKDIFFDKNGLLRNCLYDDNNTIPIEDNNTKLVCNEIDSVFVKNIECTFEKRITELKWNVSDTTYKRVYEILSDLNFTKSIIISKRIKEYFIKQGVRVEEDKKHGHKIYITY